MHASSFIVDVEDTAHHMHRRLASAPGRLAKPNSTATSAHDDYVVAVPDSTHDAPTPKMKPKKKAVETSEDTYDAGAAMLQKYKVIEYLIFVIPNFQLISCPTFLALM